MFSLDFGCACCSLVDLAKGLQKVPSYTLSFGGLTVANTTPELFSAEKSPAGGKFRLHKRKSSAKQTLMYIHQCGELCLLFTGIDSFIEFSLSE